VPSLRLKLLGGFEARLTSGAAVDTPSKKTRALLVYLALPAGRAHARDQLACLLWSDRGHKQAHDSLRQTLSKLDRAVSGVDTSLLTKSHDTVALDASAVAVDALEFERLATSANVNELRRADGLYAGDLFDGFGVHDPAFEDWLRFERQRLRDLATSVLKKLLACEVGLSAVETAQRLVGLDPLQEEGHRALMRLYAEAGEIGMALRQYETCRKILEHELAVPPSPETDKLNRRLRSREGVSGPAAGAPIHDGEQETMPPATARRHLPSNKLPIAVLPFDSINDDPAQKHFSNGITEDIIAGLSRFHDLSIRAPSASSALWDKTFDVQRMGRELGVQYVVEGSVRRFGDRVRIASQLVEASSGDNLWAERFDCDQQDIVAVQDNVVRSLVGTLAGRLKAAGVVQARRKPPTSLAAYDYVLRGDALPVGDVLAETEARRMFEKAVELDPTYGFALALLAYSLSLEWRCDTSGSNVALDRALELAKKAVHLDDANSECNHILGWVYLVRGAFDLAEHYYQRALALNPSSPLNVQGIAEWLAYVGRADEAMKWFRQAKLIDPLYNPSWWWRMEGAAHFNAREYDEAIAAFSRSPIISDSVQAYIAASHALAHRPEDAREAVVQVLDLSSDFSASWFVSKEPYKRLVDRQHLLEGLRRAGLPE
jgi:adenylate cyclase